MCEQKRHRSASLYAFHSQSNGPLLHAYVSYTPLDCKNAPIFFYFLGQEKKMCVYYCMEKLNRVGRLENVFILLKKFYMGIIERKTSSPKGNDRSPESNVPRSNLISKNMSLLPRNKLAWRHHFPSITLWNIFQTFKGH